MFPVSRYPRATSSRLSTHDKTVKTIRSKYLRAALFNFAALQLLFLGLFSYIFGAIYQQSSHTHNLNILYVDYDGGIIGTAIRNAYNVLKSDSFPTLDERSTAQYPSTGVMEHDICSTKFWAALYTEPGATMRLQNALSGASSVQDYDRADVMSYIWNEARFPATVDGSISAPLQSLASAARLAFVAANGTGALDVMAVDDNAALPIFADPWHLTSVNIQPTTQGSRLIYNTLVFILILIQEFFYLGTVNGLYAQLKIYSNLYPHRIIIYRNTISGAYTFVGSLCTTGAIWAFRAGWKVNGSQFVLSWMILWLFAHANFLWLDVFTVWFPVQFVPMALITWVVLNVTSILAPFELSPGFYKWGYIFPAHETYRVLTDIWSGGCVPTLYYALPILFAIEIAGLVISGLGVYRRCHYAVLGDEAQERAFKERLDAAVAFEQKKDTEMKETPETEIAPADLEGAMTRRRESLAEAIREEDEEVEKEKAAARKTCNFGPSFGPAL